MTHAEEIIRAVGALGKDIFTRAEVRIRIGASPSEWRSRYTSIFQGMREDHPGGAPDIGERWEGLFRRVAHGKYTLTDRGRELLSELEGAEIASDAVVPEPSKPSSRPKETLRWQTSTGDQMTVGNATVTPQSKALIVRFPGGGFVWNRPVAVLVERGGRVQRFPIVDVTRMAQLGLLGLGMVISVLVLILSGRRRRLQNE